MTFLYFLPGAGTPTAAEIAAAGLSCAFESPPLARGVSSGPGGDSGHVLACGPLENMLDLGFHPDRQQWRRIPGSPAWLGVYADRRPGPEDLVRAEPLNGHWTRLGDERNWLVPVARGQAEHDGELSAYCALPAGVGLDDQGRWTCGQVLDRYRPLWAIAAKFWDAWIGAAAEDAAGFDFAELNDAATAVLSANYRIGRVEAATLGLLDGGAAQRILLAVIDWPTIERWLKKKANSASRSTPAGSSTAAGGGG